MSGPDFQEFNLAFDGYLCDIVETNSEFVLRYYGRSLLRSCLTFNDMELGEDPWDYKGLKPR